MADPSPAPAPAPHPPLTPSSILSGLPGTMLALVTAIGGLITTYQSFQESQATSKASYEALKTAVDANTETLAAQSRAQAELRSWLGDLTDRIEKRQATAEKAIARKAAKASSSPVLPFSSADSHPPVPPAPSLVKRAPLPPFERLETP